MDLSTLSNEELQQLANMGNFQAMAELAERRISGIDTYDSNQRYSDEKIQEDSFITTPHIPGQEPPAGTRYEDFNQERVMGSPRIEDTGVGQLYAGQDTIDDDKAWSYANWGKDPIQPAENQGGVNNFWETIKSFSPVGNLLDFIGNQFEYRPAQRGVYGYSAAELDKMNARGGWYSEPARAARRWEKRQSNILSRAAQGKRVGNVDKLLGSHGYTSDGQGGISYTGPSPTQSQRDAGATTRQDSGWDRSPFGQGGIVSLKQD